MTHNQNATIIPAYPLTLPHGFPRTTKREAGKFNTSLACALKNVQRSIELFAKDSGKSVSGLVLSSNCTLGPARPADPGIAAWFNWDGLQVCIAIDRYLTPESNLQAIHHIIEARRTELRHGTLAMVRATFTGLVALPAPTNDHWSKILQVEQSASIEEIEGAFLRLAKTHHPDKGGSDVLMARLNTARATALKDRSSEK